MAEIIISRTLLRRSPTLAETVKLVTFVASEEASTLIGAIINSSRPPSQKEVRKPVRSKRHGSGDRKAGRQPAAPGGAPGPGHRARRGHRCRDKPECSRRGTGSSWT